MSGVVPDVHDRPADVFRRVATCLAAAWLGALLALGGLAAPAGFAVAPVDVAGRLAGRLFQQEAAWGIGVAVVLLVLLRRRAKQRAEAGKGSQFPAELVLLLAAVACTAGGYYALLPMMAAARAGQGSLSFGALHGLSMAAYGLKAVLVGVLAWRLTRH